MLRFVVFGCLVFALELMASLTNAMSCGVTTNSLSGTITGPLKIGNYQQYAFECVWTINAPSGYKINLKPQQFQLPGTPGNCGADRVAIDSLFGNEKTLSHGIFCGSSLPPNVLSKQNRLRITYKYNGNYNRRENSYFTFNYRSEFYKTAHYITGEWIKKNAQKFSDDKPNLPRIISALFLFNETYFSQGNVTAKNLTTEYRLKLAADLIRNSTHPLTASALSHHVNALLAICRNPRSVYGRDLVRHLRKIVNKKKGLVNPYYLLTLCNAGDQMTSSDITKLKTLIELKKQDVFWLDFQAMALMGLICAKEQNKSHDIDKEISKASAAFKRHQKEDGSFGSLQTTSLIIQALTVAEALDLGWNKTSAFQFVERSNHSDGSFGNIYNLLAAIPVISHKTLLNISVSNCDFTPGGLTPLDEIEDKLTEQIHVLYSLWIGDQVDFSYTITIKVPNGTKFLDFMRLAAERDEKFQFRWTQVNNAPYVYEINGLVNDPANGKYWTLLTGTDPMNLRPYTKQLDDFVPSDGEIAVMWYKTINVDYQQKEIDGTIIKSHLRAKRFEKDINN